MVVINHGLFVYFYKNYILSYYDNEKPWYSHGFFYSKGGEVMENGDLKDG